MKFRLFLCDFDGTLIGGDGVIPKQNIEAIKRYRAAGGTFVVVTGRMYASIRQRLHELGIEDGVVVAYQGAYVADVKTGAPLKNSFIPKEEILSVVRFMEEKNFHVQIYANDRLYAGKRTPLLDLYESVCRIKATVPDVPLSEYAEREGLSVIKAVALCEPERRGEVHAALEREFGDRFFVADAAPIVVELVPKTETKGEAVRFLSEYYSVPKEEMAAIGDEETDISMVSEVGGKFAVANAIEALKRIARVVPSAEDGGVACALEYALGEKT